MNFTLIKAIVYTIITIYCGCESAYYDEFKKLYYIIVTVCALGMGSYSWANWVVNKFYPEPLKG